MKVNKVRLENFLSIFRILRMNSNKLFYFFLFYFAFTFCGCSTIFTGTNQDIRFNSNPKEATVYVDGEAQNTTPCIVDVKKGVTHDIVIRKNGYRDYKTILNNRKHHWTVWLNLVTLNIGWLVDAATGASEYFLNNYIEGNLIKLPQNIDSSQPVSFENFILSLKNNEIGVRYKEGKPQGVIFKENNTFNLESFKNNSIKEFEYVGFVVNEDSELTIQPYIVEVKTRLDEQRKGRFTNIASMAVKWDILSDGKLIYTTITEGRGVWESDGSTSIELAFNEALFRFLLDDELYSITKYTK
jgi:hypothetical protein